MALTHDIRLALAARVQRRVEGRGIPRHVIDDAIERVGEALERLSPASETRAPRESIVAVFTARTAPDLGSRVRAALLAESVTPFGMGSSTSGRHTVATVRLAADARPAAERAASRVLASISFVPDPFTPTSSQ